MLQKLKLRLGITDTSQDALLNSILEQATYDFKTITHRNDTLTPAMEYIVIEMATHIYNLLGTEGLSAESYSGASFTYSTDYPEALCKKIRAMRKAIIV